MQYSNKEAKVQDLIAQFNARQINLIPKFQRRSVWTLRKRRKLLENMLMQRPIPSVFFFKSEDDTRNIYNILDGKQRLESLLLFIGKKRPLHKIDQVHDYFPGTARGHLDFTIKLDGKQRSFHNLPSEYVRRLLEYPIPTVEIDLEGDDAAMDDVIELFIDLNTMGEKVRRFDIAKSFRQGPLFVQVFSFIGSEQPSYKSQPEARRVRMKRTAFARVLKRLHAVRRDADTEAQVDRMWERLIELAMFSRSGEHRSDILKQIVSAARKKSEHPRLTHAEERRLRTAFTYLDKAYRAAPALAQSRFATDLPHFYTMITTVLSSDISARYEPKDFGPRVARFGRELDKPKPSVKAREFAENAQRQTTHSDRRRKREVIFLSEIAR